MMDPDPKTRPSIDEILLHPRLQIIQGALQINQTNYPISQLRLFSVPSANDEDKIVQLQFNAIENPLSSRRFMERKNESTTTITEMILISPRILKTAQK